MLSILKITLPASVSEDKEDALLEREGGALTRNGRIKRCHEMGSAFLEPIRVTFSRAKRSNMSDTSLSTYHLQW